MKKRKRHKWSGKPITRTIDGGVFPCLNGCGCLREFVKGEAVYFLNDSVYHKAPPCKQQTSK
jgi:hypothetical protein